MLCLVSQWTFVELTIHTHTLSGVRINRILYRLSVLIYLTQVHYRKYFNTFLHSTLLSYSRFWFPLVLLKDVSLCTVFPGICQRRSHKFSLQDSPSFFLKISMPRKESRSRLESGFKVIAQCEALTALFPLCSRIHGRTFCKQLPISRALLRQKHRDEEQRINMSHLLYLRQLYKCLLKRRNLWTCTEVLMFLLELPCLRYNKVIRRRNSCSTCQQNFSRQSTKCISLPFKNTPIYFQGLNAGVGRIHRMAQKLLDTRCLTTERLCQATPEPLGI